MLNLVGAIYLKRLFRSETTRSEIRQIALGTLQVITVFLLIPGWNVTQDTHHEGTVSILIQGWNVASRDTEHVVKNTVTVSANLM